VRLDESVLAAMEAYNGLAPAHNPPYITGIRLFAQRMPKVCRWWAVRDRLLPVGARGAMRYAVPERGTRPGVRRWGFHGASHKFIAERSAELLGRERCRRARPPLYVTAGQAR
jgi:acetate kinase